MPAMAGTLYLGTSGFGYDEWKHGVFYPEGMPAGGMLAALRNACSGRSRSTTRSAASRPRRR